MQGLFLRVHVAASFLPIAGRHGDTPHVMIIFIMAYTLREQLLKVFFP
jgi:hypothetical protein